MYIYIYIRTYIYICICFCIYLHKIDIPVKQFPEFYSPHFVRKVKELDQVVWEVNCFLASGAEKLIKEKFQDFIPRTVRETLSQSQSSPSFLTQPNPESLNSKPPKPSTPPPSARQRCQARDAASRAGLPRSEICLWFRSWRETLNNPKFKGRAGRVCWGLWKVSVLGFCGRAAFWKVGGGDVGGHRRIDFGIVVFGGLGLVIWGFGGSG